LGRVKKILNIAYIYYLKIFYKTISLDKTAIVDFRCEIEQKSNIAIGKRSKLYKNITIYKQKKGVFKIGDFSHIAPYGYLLIENQSLTIGDNVSMGPFCSIFCSSNAISCEKNTLFKDSYVKGDVRIGNNIFIGAQCVVLPNTIIEDNVVVAANSTVKGRLEAGCLYGGNPARKIRMLNE